MTRRRRILIALGGALTVVVLGWAALIGAVYAVGGVATVQVRDASSGTHLYLPVPGVLLDAALAATRFADFGHGHPGMHFAAELHGADLDELSRGLEAVLRALEDCPDATLVEVVDGGTTVRVRKEGGSLRVEVDEPGLSVTVSVPTRTVRRGLGRLLA